MVVRWFALLDLAKCDVQYYERKMNVRYVLNDGMAMVGLRKTPQNRMTLNFRDAVQLRLFQGWVKSQAAQCEGMSPSAWIIDDVLGRAGLLDGSELTKSYIAPLYAGEITMQEALTRIFRANINAGGGRAAHPDALKLVRFVHDISLEWELRIDTSTHYAQSHFLGCLEAVVELVENYLGNEPGKRYGLSNNGRFGRELLHEYGAGYTNEPTGNIIRYCISNWEAVGEHERTYALVGDCMELSANWRDVIKNSDGAFDLNHNKAVAERRDELVAVLREVCGDWLEG